jgi:hypothetical protein
MADQSKGGDVMKGHVVIINWHGDGLELLRTLRPDHAPESHNGSPPRDVVIVAREPVSLPGRPEFRNTYVHVGDPMQEYMLERANIENARTVILLADRQRENPDDYTLTLSLDINQYLRGRGLPTILDEDRNTVQENGPSNGGRDMVRVVAEVLDPASAPVFRNSQISGIHEVVCEQDLGLRILAQCSESPGMSRLLGELLDRSASTSEIHQVPVPDHVVGHEFASMRELFRLVYGEEELVRPEGNKTSIPLLIGFMRWERGRPRMVINPRNRWFNSNRAVSSLRKVDALLVIGKGGQDATRFVFETSTEVARPFGPELDARRAEV